MGLRVVFMGTPEFAVPALEAILTSSHQVVGVVTAPDKPQGRGLKLVPSAVKASAVNHGIKVLQPEKLKDTNFHEELKSLNADVFIVIAFRMLPEVVWSMPPHGTAVQRRSTGPLSTVKRKPDSQPLNSGTKLIPAIFCFRIEKK
jgi:methionyl-tRNA formyltransferase